MIDIATWDLRVDVDSPVLLQDGAATAANDGDIRVPDVQTAMNGGQVPALRFGARVSPLPKQEQIRKAAP